ncbi:MAG: hypothetical protein A3D24_04875 [Candidatus Blackburnbacteria bacterium RIFCSPHIGHO2_02_FULL_39_13]|uniref:Uncharacterized protein n=1 Tax=Candidatus Blackburnbacteria bacterium RIFCSPLOWO2_01_FULL_40_20 TaxID=1797519 RepID=A0A1G1VBM2_9BACT|nr:MAG: hypothetical protein A2694_03545 [Candidatus Blackburnbacteria bacterium RIFCSPHIGHO2_01_FULL_40_17]OGY08943.1 MAG: hypothetical protein A3D24_04875 [Candidatus Blackburnbacteria bacterium RIFCSPHIGHO2_02_FULL_39_13]OGY12711.1 MAG: hypothetical protein A3A77_00270 [Candidatus Blackburnbacteria bacterium RIFCSPLOWO2_01_FULL_40_20]OGY15307.1 MAG: hypothetical protein A3I52_01225 [Candidatus Blackburnbacteria bacterium RIFCSPLOWO2_02_FULL_40_10]
MRNYRNKIGTEKLNQVGAAIKVKISSRGQKEPYKIGWAKIDTGGSHTHIEKKLIESLKLKPFEKVLHSNSSVEKEPTDRYLIHMYFPKLDVEGDFKVTASNMKFEKFEGEPVMAILGRDFLRECKFIYNGKTGEYQVIIET